MYDVRRFVMDWDRAYTRAPNLEIHSVSDGYVIYQPERDRIHYLNHTSVIVLELCNGGTTAREIAAFLKDAYNLSELPTSDVEECFTKLCAEQMVQ
jgi:hypothetical protein